MVPRFVPPLSVFLAVLPGFACDVSAATGQENPSARALAYEGLGRLDFAALKLELERAGWPAVHVQAFLNAEIQHRLCPPPRLAAEDFRLFEFWRTGPDAEPLAHLNTAERRAERTRREDAARIEFDTLLPPEEQNADKLLLAWEDRRRWGDLPAERRRAVAALLAQAEKEKDELLGSRGGMLTPDEHRRLWNISEQARAGIAGLLSDGELLDFDLRNSATANRMRSELDNFQPTREEFLGIFRVRHAIELAFDHKSLGHADPEVARQRADAEAEAARSIASLLGPERYDDYRLSLQPACQTLQFDGRFARSDAPAIRRLYRSLLATRAALRESDSLPEAEKTTRAAELKRNLHDQFRLVLDEEGTRRYLQEQSLWP
jgi:hypothetical protein